MKSYSSGPMVRCHHSHPPLKLGGGVFKGGSCYEPAEDADVTVALDGFAKEDRYPWHDTKPVMRIHFPIPDMGVTKDLAEFKNLIIYLTKALSEGKTVHVGCIGGHGRTGTVLAALYKHITGEEDAITSVRGLYCQKAVESSTQVNWLHTHFGIQKVAGAKELHEPANTAGWTTTPVKHHTPKQTWPKSSGGKEFKGTVAPIKSGKPFANAKHEWARENVKHCIWTSILGPL